MPIDSVSLWLSFWGGVGGSLVTVGLVVLPLGRWVWRRFVNSVAEAVHRIEKQVTPNGGQDDTLATRVQRMENFFYRRLEWAGPEDEEGSHPFHPPRRT